MKNSRLKAFVKQELDRTKQQQAKGGRETLPALVGSTGLVGWDEVDVRIKDAQGLRRPQKLSV